MFGWLPPWWLYYKLNSDGAKKRSGLAGAGGLIWDATGRWHGGFCMNIGICSVTIAEFWGLYQGLVLAWQIGIRLLMVEIDRFCVTQLLNRNNFNATFPLVNDFYYQNHIKFAKIFIKSYSSRPSTSGFVDKIVSLVVNV